MIKQHSINEIINVIMFILLVVLMINNLRTLINMLFFIPKEQIVPKTKSSCKLAKKYEFVKEIHQIFLGIKKKYKCNNIHLMIAPTTSGKINLYGNIFKKYIVVDMVIIKYWKSISDDHTMLRRSIHALLLYHIFKIKYGDQWDKKLKIITAKIINKQIRLLEWISSISTGYFYRIPWIGTVIAIFFSYFIRFIISISLLFYNKILQPISNVSSNYCYGKIDTQIDGLALANMGKNYFVAFKKIADTNLIYDYKYPKRIKQFQNKITKNKKFITKKYFLSKILTNYLLMICVAISLTLVMTYYYGFVYDNQYMKQAIQIIKQNTIVQLIQNFITLITHYLKSSF